MKKTNFYNQGQGLLGAILVLLIVGLVGGAVYMYLNKPIVELSGIAKEQAEEEVVEPEGTTPSSEEESPEQEIPQEEKPEEKLVEEPTIQKCADGTLYGQCSTNKPKYCENGNLIEKTSLCGCLPNYEVYANRCREKLAEECGILHEGVKDYSKAVNFVIVPADSLYGTLLNDPTAQYSNNLNVFISDARRNVDDFLSVDPMSQYKNIFNFYYATTVIECTVQSGRVVCDSWEEIADSCNTPYDVAVVLQRKEGGGVCCKPIVSSAFSTHTFVHEIGHYFGFRDYDYIALPPGPNHCNALACCGGDVCQFEHWSQQKPIEKGGPECCLYQGEIDGTFFYIPNEQSVMSYGVDYNALKFNHLEKTYLEKLFAKIVSSGKESVRCGEQRLKLEEYCKPIIKSQ